MEEHTAMYRRNHLSTPVWIIVLGPALAFAQTPNYQYAKTPVTSGKFVHLQDGLAPVNVQNGSVSASGVWVDAEKKNPPAGPSVSNISCLKSEQTCQELEANIADFGDGTFSLSADRAEYHVERWNDREIVAKGEPIGICKVLNVLRIDLKLKKVYVFETLSEPVDEHLPQVSKDLCNKVGSNWELHEQTPFSVSPDAKTLVRVTK